MKTARDWLTEINAIEGCEDFLAPCRAEYENRLERLNRPVDPIGIPGSDDLDRPRNWPKTETGD